MPEREAHVEFHLPIMDLPQWVIWRYEQRAGKEKPTKVPYQPRRPGLKAASTRAHEWGTYGEAIEAAATADGVGFVFARGDGYVGVDLDDCRDPQTGKLKAWARDIIDRLPSYAEISPSGRGVHIYARGHLPEGGRKVGPVEIYDQGRYFTFTGQPLPGSPLDIAEQQDAIETLYAELAPEEPPTAHNDGPPEPLRLDDAEVIRRAMGAKNGDKFRRLWQGDIGGYPSQSEAEMALASMLAFWVGRDQAAIDRLMRQSGLYRPKWDEKHFTDGRTYGQATAARAASTTRETFGSNARAIPKPAAPEVNPVTGEIEEERLFIWANELDSLPELSWIIEGLMPEDSLGAMVGGFGSRKTFALLDLSCCIGTGRQWHGRAVKQGYVVYVYAEGLRGLRSRVRAWEEANKRPVERVAFVPRAIRLLDDEDVDFLISRIAEELPEQPTAIVIDTLARAMVGGDENDQKDMGLLVESADKLRRATKAAVWFAHHTNRQKEYRGSSALPGALDVMVLAEKTGDLLTLSCEKMKDAEEFEPIQLLAVAHGPSIALEDIDGWAAVQKKIEALSDEQTKAYETLCAKSRGATFTEWMNTTAMALNEESGTRFKSTFNRIRDHLKRVGIVYQDEEIKLWHAKRYVQPEEEWPE